MAFVEAEVASGGEAVPASGTHLGHPRPTDRGAQMAIFGLFNRGWCVTAAGGSSGLRPKLWSMDSAMSFHRDINQPVKLTSKNTAQNVQ